MAKKGRVKWGVLGAASIAVRKVIPGMQLGELSEIYGLASRDHFKAQSVARTLGIAKTYGSYEELLADEHIEAVYIPLPNHLHVPWAIKACEAGKHVLCEKPIGLSVEEVKQLIMARDRAGVLVGEAFMVRTHPQWVRTRGLIRSGRIGELKAIMGAFSYFNRDAANVRNVLEWGGGGVMDIGCYPIFTSRMIFDQEPRRVAAVVERDPEFRVDRLASAILDFPSGQSIWMCSTQMVPYQRMQFFGTQGRIEIEIPFNAPPDRETRILVDDGFDVFGGGVAADVFQTTDQYTMQGDAFSRAIREDTAVPVPLEDSLKNMAVIEAVLRAGESRQWEDVRV
ncbi:MAG TPA: Gfo/Idh/MocA family oxidoreductase [Candidatus Acidoferrum sp.]|jgi:predicted dehydrogenase